MPSPRVSATLQLLFVAVVAAGASIAAGRHDTRSLETSQPQTWNGLVGARPDVALPARSIVVLRTPSLAARVHAAGGHASPALERAWTAAALAAQNALLARLSTNGIDLHPELRFTRVLDGFSAQLDPATAARLEQDRDVFGVYPDRIAYAAASAARVLASPEFADGSGHRVQITEPGLTGKGVTIALLDTWVDGSVGFLHGAVLPEIDVVGPTRGERAAERHGTEMAGLLVGANGPGGLTGVAPDARLQPIRVAGRQRDTRGVWSVFARGDQIVAGLDRAVDPNGDGDAHDALPVALLALAEPYAGFADSPESLAVSGALALGTLVVAPAGNDGPAAVRFGDLSGPGGAAGALTAGAIDTRPAEPVAHVSLHAGGTTWSGTVPLAGPIEPTRSLDLDVVQPRASGSSPAGFFAPSGSSLVAGAAALVTPGTSPAAIVRRAAAAGASAVLVGGPAPLAAGGLPLDGTAELPVISIPHDVAVEVRRRLRNGRGATVSIQSADAAANPVHEQPAAFSSTGLAFSGAVKPELVAPGVALATADPDVLGAQRWVTVSGTSAAAAATAGALALLAQARPQLGSPDLAALLVGHASTIGGTLAAQGSGMVNLHASVLAQDYAVPATVTVRDGTAAFRLVNASTEPLDLTLSSAFGQGGGTYAVTFTPSAVTLPPGATRTIRAHFAVTQAPGSAAAEGLIIAAPARGAGSQLQIPWALRFPPRTISLLGRVRLSSRDFSASAATPAALSVDAGRLFGPSAKPDVRALSRLDVELWRGRKKLGLLARLRDVLPGRYTFGLTGRGPEGQVLSPGDYAVVVVATPVDGGKQTRRKVRFALR